MQARLVEKTPNDILYFCDESSHIDDEFMAVGGIAVRRKRVAEVVRRLDLIREECGYRSEVKWSSAKVRRKLIHLAFARYLKELLDAKKAELHIRFAPFNAYDHRESGPRGRKDTVSKMYYQLLLHRPAAFYGKTSNIFVFPDGGDCTEQLSGLRGPLCADAFNKKGCRPDCIKQIEPRSSASEPMLQLLDVTLGALTAGRNRRQLGDFKAALLRDIHELHDRCDLTKNSPPEETTMNIWNVQPKRGP